MRRNPWIIPVVIALVLDVGGTLVNYFYYRANNWLLWAVRMHGGEVTVEIGFGLRAVHLFAMTPDDITTHSLVPSPLGFLLTLMLLTACVRALLLLAGMFHGRK